MPYVSVQQTKNVSHDDGAFFMQQDGDPVINGSVSETRKRGVVLSVNIPTATPVVLGLSALGAAWLGTQLLQLAAIADDIADESE